MGCDIHLYAEKKYKGKRICISPLVYKCWDDDYENREFGDIFRGRNYELFGWLAQVRTQQPDGFEPRGLPKDLSIELQELWNEMGEHTPSYLTLTEILSKPEIGKIARFREEVIYFLEDYTRDVKKGINDTDSVRIFFWFDS